MELAYIEILGFAAGATTLVSSAPQLIANLRNPDLARMQSLARNGLQAAGNMLWFVYGASVGSTSMITFSGFGFLMASCLAFQTYRVQRKAPGRKEVQPSSWFGATAT